MRDYVSSELHIVNFPLIQTTDDNYSTRLFCQYGTETNLADPEIGIGITERGVAHCWKVEEQKQTQHLY